MPRAEDGSKFGDGVTSVREVLNKADKEFRSRFYHNMQTYSEDRLLFEAWAKDNFVSSGRSQTTILERTAAKVEEKEHET